MRILPAILNTVRGTEISVKHPNFRERANLRYIAKYVKVQVYMKRVLKLQRKIDNVGRFGNLPTYQHHCFLHI